MFGVTLTELTVSRGSIVIVNTTLFAATVVLSVIDHSMVPWLSGCRSVGMALAWTTTEIFVFGSGGGGGSDGCVVLNAWLKVVELPFTSNAVTLEVRVMVAAFICATTVMFIVCPGAMPATLQMVCVTPAPTAVQLP